MRYLPVALFVLLLGVGLSVEAQKPTGASKQKEETIDPTLKEEQQKILKMPRFRNAYRIGDKVPINYIIINDPVEDPFTIEEPGTEEKPATEETTDEAKPAESAAGDKPDAKEGDAEDTPGEDGADAEAEEAVVEEPNRVTAKNFVGRMTIVTFLMVEDKHSRKQVAHLKKLYEQYESRGLKHLLIALDKDALDVKAFLKQEGIEDWPTVCDENQWKSITINLWGVPYVPYSFILNPEGELVWRGDTVSMDGPLFKAWEFYPTLQSRRYETKLALKNAINAIERKKTVGDAMVELHRLPDEPIKDEGTQQDAAYLLKMIANSDDKEAAVKAIQGNPEVIQKLYILAKEDTKPNKTDPDKHNPPKNPDDDPKTADGKNPNEQDDPNEDDANQGNRTRFAESVLDAWLESAQNAEQDGRSLDAYEQYKTMVDRAAASDQGREAIRKVKEYEADKTFMARYQQVKLEKQARAELSLAKAYLDLQKYELVRAKCEAVITMVPNSDLAKEARAMLDKLPEE